MSPKQQKMLGIVVAGGLFLVMALAVAGTAPWQTGGSGGAEDLDEIVQDLFDEHVIALEVLGILLTAAMIGALVIARPLGATLDSERYPRVSEEELERTRGVAEPSMTFTHAPLVLEDGGEEE